MLFFTPWFKLRQLWCYKNFNIGTSLKASTACKYLVKKEREREKKQKNNSLHWLMSHSRCLIPEMTHSTVTKIAIAHVIGYSLSASFPNTSCKCKMLGQAMFYVLRKRFFLFSRLPLLPSFQGKVANAAKKKRWPVIGHCLTMVISDWSLMKIVIIDCSLVKMVMSDWFFGKNGD